MPRSFLIRKSTTKSDSEDQETLNKQSLLPVSSSHRIESSVISSAPESSEGTRFYRGLPTAVDEAFIISDVAATTEIDTSEKCTRFPCTLCCRVFNRASDLKRHQLAHVEAKPYLCQICDRQFTWLGNFQKHYATHSQPQSCFSFFEGTPLNVLRSSPSSIFYEGPSFNRVPVCYGNIQRESVPRETTQNNAQQSLICNVCSLTFTTTRALKMHTRIHTGVKPYKCSQCDKAFARKDELHTHKYSHTGEKPFKCDKCSASFVRFGHLQRHKFVHYEVKPYQCKVCPKSFTQYRNLQTHMYKHTGERPFKCKYCPKGFTQYGTLQAHERIHTGERPFTCNLCQRRFITSSHLRWHVRTQH